MGATGKDASGTVGGLAGVDPITGLADRAFLDALLATSLADPATSERVGLITVEVDQFEAILATEGDAAGEALVLAAVRRMREGVRGAGLIARTGANEIAVVMTDAPDSTTVAQLAERLRLALVRSPLRAGSGNQRATASFGVAHSATSGPEPERLASIADCALARSRATGRNRVTSIAIDVSATLPHGIEIAN